MGPTHVPFAFACGLGYGVAVGMPAVQAFAVGVLATATSAGRLSPDVDQRPGWRRTDKAVPDEALGAGGPMQHRGITHWWFWPALAWWSLGQVPTGVVGWIPQALVIGWASHLLGDFLFGKDRGIPLGPWFWHVGLGLDTDGALERWLVRPVVLPAAVAVLGLAAVGQLGAVFEMVRRAA